MRKKIIIIGLLVVFMVAFGIWKWTFRPADADVRGYKTDMTIKANELVLKFTQNEDSANLLYLDKVIEITGTVDTVMLKDREVSVYLRENGASAGVICSFDKQTFNSAKLRKGDKIMLKGICSGYLMDVVMNKCSLQ